MTRLLATLVFTLAAFLGIVLLTEEDGKTDKPRAENLFSPEEEADTGPVPAPTEIYQPPERSALLTNAPREFLRDLSQEYRALQEKAMLSIIDVVIERDRRDLPKLPFKTLLDMALPASAQDSPLPSRYEVFACFVSDDGYLATNAHLVLGASRLEAKGPNGIALSARLAAVDYASNLALLKVEEVKTVPAQWSDMLQTKPGDLLFRIHRLEEQPVPLEVGVWLGRSRLPIFSENVPEVDLLKTAFRSSSRQLNGVLLNAQGELVGLETPVIGGHAEESQVSYALPANSMRQICRALIEGSPVRRHTLGMQFQALTAPLARTLGLPVTEGLLVVSPQETGAVTPAPLVKNDVLLTLNNERVGSVGQLARLLSQLEPGAKAEVSLLRNQEALTVQIPILEAVIPLPPWQEIHVREKPAAKAPGLFDGLEVSRTEAGQAAVAISKVKEGSPADWSGLKTGMSILEIDGIPADSPGSFQKLASEKKEASSSVIWLKQDGRYFYLILQSNIPPSP